jgi:heme exporter protein C
MAINLYQFSSPKSFYPLARKMAPYFLVAAILLSVVGLYIALFVAPTDFQQGEAYRIIFVHVPAAWMSMLIYVAMAFWCAVGLSLNSKLSFMFAQALAPTGAVFTVIALVTGSLWGKPMWGSWWVWDARLTSELILLFLYVGFIALQSAFEDQRRADYSSAIFNLIGIVNVPIIYFSVIWWNTLHQGASISFTKAPAMAATMLIGMVIMTIAFWAYAIAVSLFRIQFVIQERNKKMALMNSTESDI